MVVLKVDSFSVIGIAGAILVLFAFYRTSVGKWTGKTFWYEFDNLVGSLCLVIYGIHKASYITIVLNVIWLLAAFFGLTSIAERKVRRRKKRRRIGILK